MVPLGEHGEGSSRPSRVSSHFNAAVSPGFPSFSPQDFPRRSQDPPPKKKNTKPEAGGGAGGFVTDRKNPQKGFFPPNSPDFIFFSCFKTKSVGVNSGRWVFLLFLFFCCFFFFYFLIFFFLLFKTWQKTKQNPESPPREVLRQGPGGRRWPFFLGKSGILVPFCSAGGGGGNQIRHFSVLTNGWKKGKNRQN